MDLTWKILVSSIPDGISLWPARVSIPLPKGIGTGAGFSVRCPDGRVVPAQDRVLTRWPDGSPRWVQLDFQTEQAGEHLIQATAASDLPVLPVQVTPEGTKINVTVGRLRVGIDPEGTSPIDSITWNGRDLTRGIQPWRFETVGEDGKVYVLAPSSCRNLAVEAMGPHRYQVSWEAQQVDGQGQRLLDVRFRIEMLAGVEGFTLSYQFFHKLPGHEALHLKRVDCGIALEALADQDGRTVVVQTAYGNIGLRRFARTRNKIVMRLDRKRFSPHVEDAAVLDDHFDYPYFLRGVNLSTGSVVALENNQVAVLCVMRNFECQRPKTLTLCPGVVHFGLWPEDAGHLKMLQGRSHRQVFCLQFCDSDKAHVDSLLANPKSCNIEPAVCWLDKADSVHAGPTWDPPRLFEGTEPGAAFFSHLLQTATSRWETVAEMAHYGDTPDTGYTLGYPSIGRTPQVEGAPAEYIFSPSQSPHGLFHTSDAFPPVWSNNEYDAIYCLALEAVRTRDLAAFGKLQAAARHQIEVDFVHYSDHWQHHRATPAHSYDHVSGTAAIPSHQWTQGLYYYYALTGDDDVPEVVRAICDYNLLFLRRDDVAWSLYFNRELGWALVALVFGYEMTADTNYRDTARRIVQKLQQDASRTDFKDMSKICATTTGLNATGIGTGFNVNTIPLGLKAYHQATGEPWARDLLIEWVDYGMTNFNNKATGVKITELFPETFCYVCGLTGNKSYLEQSLWHLQMFFRGFDAIGWMDEHGRPLTTKQYTRVYRGLVHYLSALARNGLLLRVEQQMMGERDACKNS